LHHDVPWAFVLLIYPRPPLCADIDGFSLHAAVRLEAHDRKRLEQLCRCITRPALSDERVLRNTAAKLIAALTRANAEGRLDEKLKVLHHSTAADRRRNSATCRSIDRVPSCSPS
jgi:hypothetical protein